jgi:hypothetical protein
MRSVLWMYLPDFNNAGAMNSISKVKSRDGKGIFWEEHPECGGFTVSTQDCPFRASEMELLAYTPQ